MLGSILGSPYFGKLPFRALSIPMTGQAEDEPFTVGPGGSVYYKPCYYHCTHQAMRTPLSPPKWSSKCSFTWLQVS